MNREQYRRARRVLKNDCALSGKYYDPETGETCAVGALFREAGVDLEEIRTKRFNSIGIGRQGLQPYAQVVEDTFGLGRTDLIDLQHANDTVRTDGVRRGTLARAEQQQRRRAKVLEALDKVYARHKYIRDRARAAKRLAKQLASS